MRAFGSPPQFGVKSSCNDAAGDARAEEVELGVCRWAVGVSVQRSCLWLFLDAFMWEQLAVRICWILLHHQVKTRRSGLISRTRDFSCSVFTAFHFQVLFIKACEPRLAKRRVSACFSSESFPAFTGDGVRWPPLPVQFSVQLRCSGGLGPCPLLCWSHKGDVFGFKLEALSQPACL